MKKTHHLTGKAATAFLIGWAALVALFAFAAVLIDWRAAVLGASAIYLAKGMTFDTEAKTTPAET